MSDTMDDGIEVHFDERKGELRLTCGEAAFKRLRDQIAEEACLADILGDRTRQARLIEIELVTPKPKGFRASVLFCGCVVAAFAMGFLILIGAINVVHWAVQKLAL
jgi:hypothetical protein